jgi:hypothetical protein
MNSIYFMHMLITSCFYSNKQELQNIYNDINNYKMKNVLESTETWRSFKTYYHLCQNILTKF